MISHEYKCIFIHIPKCAGTSIESALGHLNDYTGRGGQDHRSIRMIEQPLITPSIFSSKENILDVRRRMYHKYRTVMNPRSKFTVTKKQYNEYYKFTFVRNPWARVYSWYNHVMRDDIHKNRYKITEYISLNKFLRLHLGKGVLRPQIYWIKDFSGSIPLDYIGRFETLDKDFQNICNEMRISSIVLPHEKKGSGQDYRKNYDESSIDLVTEFYKEEIEIFGYSFES